MQLLESDNRKGDDIAGWAFAAVTSRAFRVRPGGPPAMLPLIDMCNHSSKPNAEVRAISKGAVELYALREISAGESVSFSYGTDLQNDFWLLDYGFVIPGNLADRCAAQSPKLYWREHLQ